MPLYFDEYFNIGEIEVSVVAGIIPVRSNCLNCSGDITYKSVRISVVILIDIYLALIRTEHLEIIIISF